MSTYISISQVVTFSVEVSLMVAEKGGKRDYVKKCMKLEKNRKISLSLGLVRYELKS